MSGEFRWSNGGYFYSVLEMGLDDGEGRHEISKLLYAVYQAAAPLERACAWVEACDSGPPELTIASAKHGAEMITAMRALETYLRNQQELVERVTRDVLNREPCT